MTTFATRATPSAAPAPEPARPLGARYRGIDGLRAIAVALVLVFHLLPGSLVGGYIGVDVFFVISGFLITGLLLRERATTGRVHFGRFWLRRARRLLPALALVLLVCSSIALAFGGDVLVGIGRQLLGATTFSYNWLDIAVGTQYFGASSPELFRNLWSLAVEEQFYLLWPLAIVAIVVIRRQRVRLGIVLGVAVLSLAAMVVLFTLTGDSTRVYYGTDTHSFGLALGAALAFFVQARPPASWRVATSRLLQPLGVLAIAGIIVMAVFLGEDGALVYRGGLAIVAVLTVIAIAACIAPASMLGRFLDLEPFRWVGVRSFGLYLWHWPLYVLLGVALPQFTADVDGLQLLGGAAACLTVVAATLSYRFVETPVRHDGFRATVRGWSRRVAATRAGAWRGVAASVFLLAVVTMTGLALIVAPAESSLQATVDAGQKAAQGTSTPPTTQPQPQGTQSGQADAPGQLPALPTGDQITAIGDSVMLAVTPELQAAYPGIDIHAKVSRQLREGPALVKKLQGADRLRPVLLIGLGTNGPIEEHDLDHILAIAGPDTKVVLVSVQAPRKWTKGVNAELRRFTAAHRNVQLADWQTAIHGHLNLLYDDKIHAKSTKGGAIYADTVTQALQRFVSPPAAAPDMGVFARPPG